MTDHTVIIVVAGNPEPIRREVEIIPTASVNECARDMAREYGDYWNEAVDNRVWWFLYGDDHLIDTGEG